MSDKKGIVIDFRTREIISEGIPIDEGKVTEHRLKQGEEVAEGLREQLLEAIKRDPSIDPTQFVFFTVRSDSQRPGAIIEGVEDLQTLVNATGALRDVFVTELMDEQEDDDDSE